MLKRLGLTILEERRIRGDIIQYFKRVKWFNEIDWFNPNTVTSSINFIWTIIKLLLSFLEK